ncbi:hypothetical protein CHU95_07535 [Niveispirillum lacus]|uniref:Uncharacterized protein n=1 Tax=Niveispirillum lacus TaxID=1981099 RepID=A0A255Z262_9PROT|nr:hypothetical protein [Niveispirillum lacus]OYQ35566.1 hypothetical protein CHU95_07535 [Niveispirillum lacus]
MPLYHDNHGQLYWHERVTPRLEPPVLSAERVAQGIKPRIARIRSDRRGWLRGGCVAAMAGGLGLTVVALLLAQRDWPLALGVSVAGFLWCAALRLFFVTEVCARSVPFDGAVWLAPEQPWPPRLLRLCLILSFAGPLYVLTWVKGLDVMDGDGPSIFLALVWAWMVWGRVKAFRRERQALSALLSASG